MFHDITRVAGVDVSKTHLDLGIFPTGRTHHGTNDGGGIGRLVDIMKAEGVTKVVFEPTGRFHRALEAALQEAGIAAIPVNPARARRFAEATGALAKTDKADALCLARMGAVLALVPPPLPSPSRQRLKDLFATRRGLIAARTTEANRLAETADAFCRDLIEDRLALMKRQIARLDQEIEEGVAAEPDLAAGRARLSSIPGFGSMTASILLVDMPELGTMTGRQAASLAGLAPFAKESGSWKGRRRIRGGRSGLRQALYMPALTAVRHNADLRSLYLRLRAAGKPGKVALTAVMRKLVVIANAMMRDDRNWATRGA